MRHHSTNHVTAAVLSTSVCTALCVVTFERKRDRERGGGGWGVGVQRNTCIEPVRGNHIERTTASHQEQQS